MPQAQQSEGILAAYVKLQRSNNPQSAQRLESSPRSRFLSFPWGANVGWPLRELGVFYTGLDQLSGRFKAGTPCSDTHLFYFVIEGSVECGNGTDVTRLTAGSWMACPAGQPHWVSHSRGKSEAVWVHLMDVPRWRFLKEHQPACFPIQHPLELHHAIVQAIREAEDPRQGSFENATSYSSIFRVALLREIARAFNREETGMQTTLTRLWAEVNTRLAEPWTVRQLAALVHVSESALYVHVARCNGLKPMQMVTRLRIERAKDLLLHSDLKLDAIAESVGYQTAFAFSDAFLRETGMRPGKFRSTALQSA